MRYEKRNPANETKYIWPARDHLVEGHVEHDIGLRYEFTGRPAITDTEEWAKYRADWEERMGKITQGSDRALDARIKELDKIIIKHIKNHKETRAGLIFVAKSKKERFLEQGARVCPYCIEDENKPVIHDSISDLTIHQLEFHREELEKQLESKKEEMIDDLPGNTNQNPAEVR